MEKGKRKQIDDDDDGGGKNVRIRCSERFKRSLDWAVLFYEVEHGKSMSREEYLDHLLDTVMSEQQKSIMKSCDPTAESLQKHLVGLHVHTPVRETKRKLVRRLLRYHQVMEMCSSRNIDTSQFDKGSGHCVVMQAEKALQEHGNEMEQLSLPTFHEDLMSAQDMTSFISTRSDR